MCRTSVERPRSTIKWYITGNPMSLGTSINTPSEDDNLSSTRSSIRLRFNRTSFGQQLFCTAFNIDGQTPKESDRKNLSVECKFCVNIHTIISSLYDAVIKLQTISSLTRLKV